MHNRPNSSSTSMVFSSTFSFPPTSFSANPRQAPSEGQIPPSPGSPPPYSQEPPESDANLPFLTRRAASSPHLSPPPSPTVLRQPRSHNSATRAPSTAIHHPGPPAALYPHTHALQTRPTYDQLGTDDDTDASRSDNDTVMYRPSEPSLDGTRRARIFGAGQLRERFRPISTAPGVMGAGETETESEDVPRILPTARLTPSTSLSTISPLSSVIDIPIPSPNPSQRQRTSLALAPLLFEFSRLLSIVPAIFGTLWNIYHTIMPPTGEWGWSVEFAVSALWSILTGWQCLQLTTGLLKRWRVYYSPLPTLIRLLALQAICWPATHLTLTILNHEVRPLICWAVIGTTTCCSRSIQMWVTSNIVEPHSPNPDAAMRARSRRTWDWGAVGRKCALPASIVYFITAWMLLLRAEFGGR